MSQYTGTSLVPRLCPGLNMRLVTIIIIMRLQAHVQPSWNRILPASQWISVSYLLCWAPLCPGRLHLQQPALQHVFIIIIPYICIVQECPVIVIWGISYIASWSPCPGPLPPPPHTHCRSYFIIIISYNTLYLHSLGASPFTREEGAGTLTNDCIILCNTGPISSSFLCSLFQYTLLHFTEDEVCTEHLGWNGVVKSCMELAAAWW